jgi:hypothetical protein
MGARGQGRIGMSNDRWVVGMGMGLAAAAGRGAVDRAYSIGAMGRVRSRR